MNSSSKPADLIDKLVSNHKEGKPLLDGAMLYRGSRLPDQSLGNYGTSLHTSLLPQVAASYTHNWATNGEAYIGAYPIDRDKTRFLPDFGMEQKGAGAPKSYSVTDVEKALEPLVTKLASERDSGQRAKTEEKIESLLKTNFYEAGVPAKTATGEASRPKELLVYTGRPDVQNRRAVQMQLKPLTAESEKTARRTMLTEHKSPSMQAMVGLLAKRTPATDAVTVILAAARRDHTNQLTRDHGSKPLTQLMSDIAKQPSSEAQQRLEKFANALNSGVGSSNPAIQVKAQMMASEIAKLDPKTVGFNDLVRVSSDVTQKLSRSAEASPKMSGAASGKSMEPPGQAAGAKATTMDR